MIVSNEIYEKALDNPDNINIMNNAGSRFIRSLDEDEIYSCKLIALWNALRNWNKDKGKKFSSFLYQQVYWECLKILTLKNKSKHLGLFDIDLEALPNTSFSDLIDCLPSDLYDIVTKKYLYGMTYTEIGKYHNCSYETIRKRLLEAYEYIKIAMNS